MGQLRLIAAFGLLFFALPSRAKNTSDLEGWSGVQLSCVSAVSYILATPVACAIALDSELSYPLKICTCVGAVFYAASQSIDCGCQICKLTGSECAKC